LDSSQREIGVVGGHELKLDRLAEQRKGKTIKALPTLQRLKGRHARQPAHA